jgi:glucose/arabinose dehydrogenase
MLKDNARNNLTQTDLAQTNLVNAAQTPLQSPSFANQTFGTLRSASFGDRADRVGGKAPDDGKLKIKLIKQLSSLQNPVYITSAKDGSNRLFVVEQAGQIQIIQQGKPLKKPFLDISDRIAAGGEQGLLSVAFPPDFARKQHFYVYYTNKAGNLTIARYRLTANANVADPRSEQVILTIGHPGNTNHNGGQLAFGGDGFLYAGTGDGGGGGDPANNAQNPKSLLGKLLRLDVESTKVKTYAIPKTNPFVKAKDRSNQVRDEIWALGLRNPWRFSFDRKTNDLYIGDVGQGTYEEVDFQRATSTGGQNYGWNIREGKHPFSNPTANPAGLVSPVTEYDHSQGSSITGGFVYRGIANPKLQGLYVYGDFVSGNLWGLRQTTKGWQNQRLLNTSLNISTFGEDEQGNLYVADYSQGDIYKITQNS